jgi:hypothetical protein
LASVRRLSLVTGLGYFKDCKDLTVLSIDDTKVTDLTLLKGMPLKELYCDFQPERDTEVLRSIRTLEKINGKSAAVFWKEADEGKAGVTPFTDADAQRIASLPAAQQVEEVRKELVRRNPGFDGKIEHKIEGGVVTEFKIVTDKVTDIAPIRVFKALRVLDCSGTWTDGPGQLVDLTPLGGMKLMDHDPGAVEFAGPGDEAPAEPVGQGHAGHVEFTGGVGQAHHLVLIEQTVRDAVFMQPLGRGLIPHAEVVGGFPVRMGSQEGQQLRFRRVGSGRGPERCSRPGCAS